MKNLRFICYLLALTAFAFVSCDDDNDGPGVLPTGQSKTFALSSVADAAISGTATFNALDDGSTAIELVLNGTPDGGSHPAHIHFNTAAEGGDIAVTLTSVDGSSGMSTTIVTATDDGTPLTFEDLLDFDGYINVHLSADDLATLVAQGDIGQNELTGMSKGFALASVADPDISGMATFAERVNGETLVTLDLENTPADGMHPAHIHFNTAVEGGGIAVTLGTVDGNTGMSKTNVTMLDDGSMMLSYEDLLDFDGYINVHFSAADLATLVAQGDIGQNELTGTSKDFALASVANPDISGMATFAARVNGETLVTLALENTPADGMHPAHIHFNTAAEGGGIAVTLGTVDGNTGMSKTNVTMLDDGSMMLSYDDLLDFDGYINVHLSAADLGTLVAQGDIGQNELTGTSMSYDLNSVDVAGVSGTVEFMERVNGETLVEINLMGTTFAGDHPSHIHLGSVAEAPGAIAVTLTSVNTMGVSKTNVTMLDDESTLSYDDLIAFDGYVNVHNSAADLGTLVAQGNIGANGN